MIFMTLNSLDNLLNQYPYFFNKNRTSNFFKSQDVTNEEFKDIYQSMMTVVESFHLNKRCLIWKEQTSPYKYNINFIANYPNMKSVSIYKNEDLIYTEFYDYDDEINNFFYIYEGNTENDVAELTLEYVEEENEESEEESLTNEEEDVKEIQAPIIPEDNFKIIIETYDELRIIKGFPENDTIEGNEFDHDISLDHIGSLNNIPRKTYIETTDYSHTEPPYNNRLTEDDYHYMNRILNYTLRLHDTPLPVLEIWKLYGLEAAMVNREKYLLKFFDETAHPFDESTGHVLDWVPESWEHKDGFCERNDDLGSYFFATPNTTLPKKWNPVTFKFQWLNNLGEPVDVEYSVRVYLNNTMIATVTNSEEYYASSSLLDEMQVNTFKFEAYDSQSNLIGTEIVDITVKGCLNGDVYVSENGDDDTGDGTYDNPYKTLDKALSQITTTQNLIVVLGNVTLSGTSFVSTNCTILGCGEATITNPISNRFFNIMGNKNITLSLLDLTLNANGAVSYVKSMDYNNSNQKYDNYLSVIVHGGKPILHVELDKDVYYYNYDIMRVTGTLTSKEGNPISNASLDILINEKLVGTATTDNMGMIDEAVVIENYASGTYDVNVRFNGSTVFSPVELDEILETDITRQHQIIDVNYNTSSTITSTGHTPGADVEFYLNNVLVDTIIADNYGEAEYEEVLPYGANLIYTMEDGHIINEFVVNTLFKISSLTNDYFITDITLENDSDVVMTKTPLASFNCIRDLEAVITDVESDEGTGLINIERFESSYSDETLLDEDNIYPADLEELNRALIDVTLVNGELKGTRGGGT